MNDAHAAQGDGAACEPVQRRTWTVPETATLLGIAQSSVWKHIAAGRIPVLRMGRRTLITREAIEDLLAEGTLPRRPRAEHARELRVMT